MASGLTHPTTARQDAPFPQARPQRATKDDPSKLARVHYPRDGPDEFPTARSFLTRPPTDTSRRAISPGEGFLFPTLHHHTFSPRGVAGLSFTARIERPFPI